MTDAGRQAAHILLDSISAWDPDRPSDFAASDLAVQRLLEVGAVSAQLRDGGDHIDIDVSPLLQGATTMMVMMVAGLAAVVPGASPLDIVARLRTQLDTLP